MSKLLALICKQCGGGLIFKNLREPVVCKQCRTNFLLLKDEEGYFYPVSYFPIPPSEGKMQIPLKLRIAKLLKESDIENLIIGDDSVYAPGLTVDSASGEIVYMHGSPMSIKDDDNPISLALVEKELVEKTVRILWKEVGKNRTWRITNVYHPLKIYVYKVNSEEGVTLGHAVEIDVCGFGYEDFANNISEIIYTGFGVLSEVNLISSEADESKDLFEAPN